MTSKLTLLFMVPKISLLPPDHNPYPQNLVYEASSMGYVGYTCSPFSPHSIWGVLQTQEKGLKEGAFLSCN